VYDGTTKKIGAIRPVFKFQNLSEKSKSGENEEGHKYCQMVEDECSESRQSFQVGTIG
jgi:hypothetical protein